MMSDRPCLAEFHFGNANVSIEFALYTKATFPEYQNYPTFFILKLVQLYM